MTPRAESRSKRIALWCIAVGVLVPGAYGFTAKLVEFIRTLVTDESGGFTLVPISNYFLIAAGMTCLLFWAIAHGMFRDVEGPKYTMLEREQELDRREGRQWSD
ncbi:MAG: hypothetical protein ACE5F9_03945 [Phycisphaerae bacterium]